MKFYRGDTLPVVASFENRQFQAGDVITAAVLQKNDNDEYDVLAETSVTSPGTADEVQLEFTREQMHDIDGDCTVEIRLVTNGNVEATLQKDINIRKDGVR